MIAERSGDNPATKIFLTVYDSSWFFCYAIDDQNQFRMITIRDGFCKYSPPGSSSEYSDKNGFTYKLGQAFDHTPVVEEVTCDVTNLTEVETIRTFFNDHPDLLPNPIRAEVFPDQRNYNWLYVGCAFLLSVTVVAIAGKYLSKGEQSLAVTQKGG